MVDIWPKQCLSLPRGRETDSLFKPVASGPPPPYGTEGNEDRAGRLFQSQPGCRISVALGDSSPKP
jgi:hypothetical protein